MENSSSLSTNKKAAILIALVVLILFIDQTSKFWVKTHMYIGQSIEIFSWFKIFFVENIGMAFGMELFSKIFLSLFRVVAIVLIIIFLRKLIRKEYSLGYILCLGSILAGAIGNLIDSAIYGLMFTSSQGQVASFLDHPEGQQYYGTFMHGKVVDMFYFPIIHYPNGEVLFFPAVFNVADSAVTVGVILIIIFFRKELNVSLESTKKPKIVKNEE